MTLHRAAIGLGSNLGDRRAHLEAALKALGAIGRVASRSGIYETAPVGGPEQGPYLNAVVVLETELAPIDLLARLREIERSRGREHRERWGPRTLDLDVLLYDRDQVDVAGLTIPHPRMADRRFVLEPLLEAWPDAALPDGTPAAGLLPSVSHQDVRRLRRAGWLVAPPMVAGATLLMSLLIWWIIDWIL